MGPWVSKWSDEMLEGKAPRRTLTIVLSVLLVGLLAGGGYYTWKKTRPHPRDPNNNYNVGSVPPPGVAPFDPKPLMDKLRARLTADKFRFAVLGDTKHAPTLPAFMKYLDETVHP